MKFHLHYVTHSVITMISRYKVTLLLSFKDLEENNWWSLWKMLMYIWNKLQIFSLMLAFKGSLQPFAVDLMRFSPWNRYLFSLLKKYATSFYLFAWFSNWYIFDRLFSTHTFTYEMLIYNQLHLIQSALSSTMLILSSRSFWACDRSSRGDFLDTDRFVWWAADWLDFRWAVGSNRSKAWLYQRAPHIFVISESFGWPYTRWTQGKYRIMACYL